MSGAAELWDAAQSVEASAETDSGGSITSVPPLPSFEVWNEDKE